MKFKLCGILFGIGVLVALYKHDPWQLLAVCLMICFGLLLERLQYVLVWLMSWYVGDFKQPRLFKRHKLYCPQGDPLATCVKRLTVEVLKLGRT